MRILRAVGVGALSGVLVGLGYLWIVGWMARRRNPGTGVFFVSGTRVLLAMIIGFAVGFVWMMRR
jgi:hypothetical protein